jgi:nitroreductase
MDLFVAIKGRRSVRKYKKQAMEKNVIMEIVDAGRFGASAYNACPWRYVVINEAERLRSLSEVVGRNGLFIKDAGAAIIALCKADAKYYIEDTSAGVQNILLAAYAKGIGTCWIAGDKKDYCPQVLSFVNAPADYRLVAIISCGYPDENPIKNKPKLDEVIVWDRF